METPLGPGGRPLRRWRPLPALCFAASLGVAFMLMLSDRAPRLLAGVARRIDRGTSRPAQLASAAPLPDSDFLIHLAVWFVVTAFVVLAAWSWRSVGAGVTGVAAVSIVVELAQDWVTLTRRTQLTDMAGNLAGVAAGALAALALAWVVGLPARRRRRVRSPLGPAVPARPPTPAGRRGG